MRKGRGKRRPAAVAAVIMLSLGLVAGCGTQPDRSDAPAAGTSSPTTNSGTDMSAQTAAGGINQKPQPARVTRHGDHVHIDMYTEETMVTIAPGVKFPAWTFDGTVPGPVLQLRQGDHVTLTLHNLDPNMAHSIDLHAALVAPDQAFTDVPPGQSKTITFTATLPGVFMYHCASDPMALHIAQGMYGAVVVTPKGEQAPTYTIVQSEFYKALDANDVLNGTPRYVVFNGVANRYVAKPLPAKVGQPLTVAFVNAGPNEFSAFHVVGSTLRDVQDSGSPENHLYNVQTYTVAPGDGILVHLRFDAPGRYPFVSHAVSAMAKGATGVFQVTH